MNKMNVTTKKPVLLSQSIPRYAFIDFGCGTGGSYNFAESLSTGDAKQSKELGLGVDISQASVETCRLKGLNVELCDMLDYNARNVATATFSIDVMPELPGRIAFERGLINLIRAARNYSVIQHASFDVDQGMAMRGFTISTNLKRVQYKPSLFDYIDFACKNRDALSLAGIAIFGLGVASFAAIDLPGFEIRSAVPSEAAGPKSIRVIIARKEVSRFRSALDKAAAGKMLFHWERA